MNELGMFFGIGVGPGDPGLLPVAALQALHRADVIYTPRAQHVKDSVARRCLGEIDLPQDRFREVAYNMDSNGTERRARYQALAIEIAAELKLGRTVAYLTIGDSMTYSTYGYLLEALDEIIPGCPRRTIPGITSYAATAASFEWPLGQGKERVLILPCPDDMEALWQDIETHDVVVLMKIGKRLRDVLALLQRKDIAGNCVFASRIGLQGEFLQPDLGQLPLDWPATAASTTSQREDEANSLGYLSTMLIRRSNAVTRQDRKALTAGGVR